MDATFQFPGGMIVYYYRNPSRDKVGSLNPYKIWQMSKRHSNTKIESCGIAEFDGELLSDEYL